MEIQDTLIHSSGHADNGSNDDPVDNSGVIRFIPRHRPTLAAGTYKIKLSQQVTVRGTQQQEPDLVSKARYMDVRGERFNLPDDWIQSVFPPEGGKGDYDNTLPHIVLTRGTLPWERTANMDGTGDTGRVPWTGLLVLDAAQADMVHSETIRLDQLDQVGKKGLLENLEASESKEDSCRVIGLPAALLPSLIPAKTDLRYLTHIRRVNHANKAQYDPNDAAQNYAVVAGNRLLEGGMGYTAFLVSLEGYYDEREKKGDWYSVKNGMIWLVCLKSWGFHVKGYYQLTAAALDALARKDVPGEVIAKLDALKDRKYDSKDEFIRNLKTVLSQAELAQSQTEIETQARHGENFQKLLQNLDTGDLRGPATTCAPAETYFDKGYTLLPHGLRQGDRTLSLFRGPFLPRPGKAEPDAPNLPAAYGDQLLRYDGGTGLFDVSYAAAWQLGRLLSLRNKSFATALVRWKELKIRQPLVAAKDDAVRKALGDVRASDTAGDDSVEAALKKDLSDWLAQLKLTTPLPLNYLVPEENMLPPGSLRFFGVDPNWMDCLIDGACSIGRFNPKDLNEEAGLFKTLNDLSDRAAAAARERDTPSQAKPGSLTGILLRSDLLVHWPGLEITGYDRDDKALPIYHMRDLAPDNLLCLFKGEIHRLEIHHPSEGLHFGVDPDGRTKRLRDRKTGRLSQVNTIEAVFHPDPDPQVKKPLSLIDTEKTAARLFGALKKAGDAPADFNAAEFAFQMIESSHSVKFLQSDPKTKG